MTALISTIILAIDIQDFLIGETEWSYIPEIMLRTLIMYSILLFSLRILGKRGVKQLSVFELVVIIGLGSAAGDPMFYKEVGVISAITVFIIVILAYKLTSYLVNNNKKIEKLLEGEATYLIENGIFSINNFKKETLAQDEFFSELRFQGISQLGQIELAIIETSGSISLFFYKDEDVKYGLPILPHLFCKKTKVFLEDGYYSCSFCGFTAKQILNINVSCNRCNKEEWVKSINKIRTT